MVFITCWVGMESCWLVPGEELMQVSSFCKKKRERQEGSSNEELK